MVVTRKIQVKTAGNGEVINLTPALVRELGAVKVRDGTVTVFVTGSTASVTTIEFEPGLLADFHEMWERLIPRNAKYEHDAAWAESNGFSHLRSSLLGPSLVIPLAGSVMTLGTWQQVVLVDFDHRPRSREVVLQIMGE